MTCVLATKLNRVVFLVNDSEVGIEVPNALLRKAGTYKPAAKAIKCQEASNDYQ